MGWTIDKTGNVCGDTSVSLKGQTSSGLPIWGANLGKAGTIISSRMGLTDAEILVNDNGHRQVDSAKASSLRP